MIKETNKIEQDNGSFESFKELKSSFEASLNESAETISLADNTTKAYEIRICLETFFNKHFGDSHMDLDKRSVSVSEVASGNSEVVSLGRLNDIFHLLNNPNNTEEETGLYFLMSQDRSGQIANLTIFFSDGVSAIPGNTLAIYSVTIEKQDGIKVEKLK